MTFESSDGGDHGTNVLVESLKVTVVILVGIINCLENVKTTGDKWHHILAEVVVHSLERALVHIGEAPSHIILPHSFKLAFFKVSIDNLN